MSSQYLDIAEARSDEELREAAEMIYGFLTWNCKRLADGWPVEAFEVQERVRDDVVNLGARAAAEGWAIFIAHLGDELAGCVALRPLSETVCELKRLFVVPHLQRAGLGRALCQRAIEAARERGFKRMTLDTADVQFEALSLFEGLGFRPSTPHRHYTPEVTARVVYMEKVLD